MGKNDGYPIPRNAGTGRGKTCSACLWCWSDLNGEQKSRCYNRESALFHRERNGREKACKDYETRGIGFKNRRT